MALVKLRSNEDIKSKLSKKYKECQIRDISTDSVQPDHYVKGKVTKKSALQKTKRFTYMKLTLQDASDSDVNINVFITGSIAEDIYQLEENTLLLLNGFLVEHNTRVQDGSHEYQLVVDSEISEPKLWYLPSDKAESEQVERRQLRSASNKETSPGKGKQQKTAKSTEREQIRPTSNKGTSPSKGKEQKSGKSLSNKQPLTFVSTRKSKEQQENVELNDKQNTKPGSKNQEAASKSPVKNATLTPVSQFTRNQSASRRNAEGSDQYSTEKAVADSTTPPKSPSFKNPNVPNKKVTRSLKNSADGTVSVVPQHKSPSKAPSSSHNNHQQVPCIVPSGGHNTQQNSPNKESSSGHNTQHQSPSKVLSNRQNHSSTLTVSAEVHQQASSGTVLNKQDGLQRNKVRTLVSYWNDTSTHPVASTSTAAMDTASRGESSNKQIVTSTPHPKQVSNKVWTTKKNVVTQKYNYKLLESVQPNTVVDIYGVIKFCKPPYKTKGRDYCMIVSVVDPTLCGEDKKLKCLLFNREMNKLPQVKVGDIIRFHRLKITTYNGESQGQSSPGLSWVVFSGKQGDTKDPLSSATPNYTITDDDKEKVQELRDWLGSKEELREGDQGCCIEDLVPGIYFDLSCQVISTCILEEGVCLLLRVWDGTKTIYPVRGFDEETEKCVVNSDPGLLQKSVDFMYDVALYDDHVARYRNIQPGQFIKLCNLHAAKFVNVEKREDLAALPTVELVIHRGTSFGRGVVFLANNWPDVKILKERFDKLTQNLGRTAPPNNTEDQIDIDELSPISSTTDKEKTDSGNGVDIDTESSENSDGRKRPRTRQSQKVTENEEVVKNKRICLSADRRNVPGTSSGKPRTRSGDVENVLGTSSVNPRTRSGDVENVPGTSSGKPRTRSGDLENVSGTSSGKPRTRSDDLNMSCDQPELDMTCDSLTQDSTSRCMLQTATVVLNHPFTKRSKLQDILRHEVPYKFRVLAHVEDYFPKTDDVSSFIKLYCPTCHHLQNADISIETKDSSSITENKLKQSCVRKGVKYYYCPKCEENQEDYDESMADSTTPLLEYIYMMRFLLNDGSGWLIANLWKQEAVTFFKDIEAVEAFKNKKLFQEVKDCLLQVCPEGDEPKPWIECCIKSYSSEEGTGFHMFDTAVA